MNINKETTIRISGWLLIGLLNAVVLNACSSRSKPPPAPKTQTAKSAKTGAIWGGLAGLVFGGNLSDAVEGAVIGGAGGAVYGSVKGNQQIKAEKNELVAKCDRFNSLKYSRANPYAFTEQDVAFDKLRYRILASFVTELFRSTSSKKEWLLWHIHIY